MRTYSTRTCSHTLSRLAQKRVRGVATNPSRLNAVLLSQSLGSNLSSCVRAGGVSTGFPLTGVLEPPVLVFWFLFNLAQALASGDPGLHRSQHVLTLCSKSNVEKTYMRRALLQNFLVGTKSSAKRGCTSVTGGTRRFSSWTGGGSRLMT
jgi:hypothetical protein